jgi:hypothetical protein
VFTACQEPYGRLVDFPERGTVDPLDRASLLATRCALMIRRRPRGQRQKGQPAENAVGGAGFLDFESALW